MLKELKEDLEEVRKMYEQKWKHQSWDRKPKKKPKRNSGAEKYGNWNEKLTRGIQRQIWTGIRISELKDRTMEIIKTEKLKEERFN